MKEAMLWKKAENKIDIQCYLCSRRCKIGPNQLGFCLVRKNLNGKLFSLNYGKLISINVDPIEKKPLFHFLPGSDALSISSAGCNFKCSYCCNWQISQIYRNGMKKIVGENYEPEQIVNMAKERNCKSISYTYTEPTIFFEFCHDTGIIAKKQKIFNTFVTNGYATPEAVKLSKKFLDAATVDFKGNADPDFYRKEAAVPDIKPIFDCLLELKRNKIHIEVTDLTVPKIGDNQKSFKNLVKFIVDNLGPETPFHILRFYPAYRLTNLEDTPVKLLEKEADIAKKEGLKFVYIGNVAMHEMENTFCPNCKNIVIERLGFSIRKINLDKKNRCKFCGEKIPIVRD